MNWKRTGTPSQIVMNNVLYLKAKQVAEIMNEFFVEKVKKLKQKFGDNFEHSYKAMGNKNCKLDMKHVTEKKILKV